MWTVFKVSFEILQLMRVAHKCHPLRPQQIEVPLRPAVDAYDRFEHLNERAPRQPDRVIASVPHAHIVKRRRYREARAAARGLSSAWILRFSTS